MIVILATVVFFLSVAMNAMLIYYIRLIIREDKSIVILNRESRLTIAHLVPEHRGFYRSAFFKRLLNLFKNNSRTIVRNIKTSDAL